MALQVLPIFSCKNSQLRVRQSCCDFFVSLVNLKPKFVADTLLDPFVSACVQVMGEDNTISLPETAHAEDTDDEGDHVSDDDDGEMLHVDPPCLLAGRLLSTMATKVSAKAFTGSLLPHISHVTQKAEIAGPLERKAAILALACLAEGNPGHLRRRVRYVLELTTQLLSDSDPVPREAAAFSLTYFCMHLQPEILIHHRQLFPALVPLLCDNVDAVRRRVARALDVLCENVAEDVEPYVPIILPAVLEAIGCSSLHTQSELCGVISSLATTRCSSFQQHAEKCLELLKPPLAMTSPETILLRAKVIETAGVVAATMEKERFMPHLPFFMERVAENLRTHQAQLREESFGFLSNLCELLQAEFAPYLDESMRCALQTIEDDRAHYKNKHILAGGAMPHFQMDDECNSEQNNNNLVGGAVEGDSDDNSHDSDESDAKEVHALVRTADLEEKSSAVYFIGVCAEVLLSDMGSHRIDVCWSALVDLDMHFHSNIRCSTLLSLAKLTQAAHGSGPVVKDVECDTLSSRARGLLDALVNETLIPCMQRETDKEVVAAACDAFELLLKFFGPQVFLTNVRDFIEVITCLLQQRMPCQQEDEDGDDSDLDEDPVGGKQPRSARRRPRWYADGRCLRHGGGICKGLWSEVYSVQ
uniref:Uncharacterized protein TCIL3000_11_16250 n=1 Tax=Trypanosoma congolense (strain IL3000) TaxID=1068625 RepID=G0V392_TRYCI|nr:unnamed protein product [Trypanosoma congolense IL3000]